MASDCRLTDSNYLGLQALHREFGPFHFSVLAFPCNQFGEAEPRPSKEVVSFARSTYGVTFPIFHKIKILGPEAEPAFRFLVGECLPPSPTGSCSWLSSLKRVPSPVPAEMLSGERLTRPSEPQNLILSNFPEAVLP